MNDPFVVLDTQRHTHGSSTGPSWAPTLLIPFWGEPMCTNHSFLHQDLCFCYSLTGIGGCERRSAPPIYEQVWTVLLHREMSQVIFSATANECALAFGIFTHCVVCWVTFFILTLEPQDLSRTLDGVGNINFHTRIPHSIIRASQHFTYLLKHVYKISVNFPRRLYYRVWYFGMGINVFDPI